MNTPQEKKGETPESGHSVTRAVNWEDFREHIATCLLYTSDAADE